RRGLGVSHGQFNEFLILVQFIWFRFEIEIDCLADIPKSLFFGFPLRPATLQRRNMGDKVAVFAWFNDDLDVHGLRLSFRMQLLEASSCYTHITPSRESS